MRKLALRVAVVLVLLGIGALFFALQQTGVFKPSVRDQLKKVSKGAEPAWYLGDRFRGLGLTDVASHKGRRVATFGYGSCRRFGSKWNPFANSGCAYALLVQTWRLDAGSEVSSDFIPSFVDGSCGRLTLRGVPAAAGSDGVVLYSGDEAIGVLGPADLVRRAVAALRPAGRPGTARLPRPATLAGISLQRCNPARDPFEPLSARIRRLLRTSELPLVTAGDWFENAQLTSAEQVGRAVSLDYESCRTGSPLGSCSNALSIDVEPVNREAVAADLHGATCTRFSVGGAPGVIWRNKLPSGDIGGVYLFAGPAVVSTAKDFVLQNFDTAKLRRVAKALRPLDAATLPKPAFDAAGLLGLCAKTS